jgi:hypothetical protein
VANKSRNVASPGAADDGPHVKVSGDLFGKGVALHRNGAVVAIAYPATVEFRNLGELFPFDATVAFGIDAERGALECTGLELRPRRSGPRVTPGTVHQASISRLVKAAQRHVTFKIGADGVIDLRANLNKVVAIPEATRQALHDDAMRREGPRANDANYPVVAEVARKADAEGRPRLPAVRAEFPELSHDAARKRIERAVRAGLLAPGRPRR